MIAAVLALALAACVPGADLDSLRLDQLRIEGSHNSYLPVPSPAEEARMRRLAPAEWPALAYGHPPLEAQLALGLRQLEIDVAPDPDGGAYAGPYADATPEAKAAMVAPGAKVLHIPGYEWETHCLTLPACLAILARWSDRNPGHTPVVVLVNSSDTERRPGVSDRAVAFDQAGIDAVDATVATAMGHARLITPDEVRGHRASLREAVRARAWPTLGQARGRFLFILDGSDRHEALLRAGHPSLAGRALFGWFDEGEPEAAVFNIHDPRSEGARITALVRQGFLVRTRADADTVEARAHDRGRMRAALASGAQLVSTDYYDGAPDPLGLGYVADFAGPPVQRNPITAPAPAAPAP